MFVRIMSDNIQMDSKLLTQKSPSVVGLKITQVTSI